MLSIFYNFLVEWRAIILLKCNNLLFSTVLMENIMAKYRCIFHVAAAIVARGVAFVCWFVFCFQSCLRDTNSENKYVFVDLFCVKCAR